VLLNNEKTYYGPYHIHNGRKMVGPIHISRPHAYIYETKEESLTNPSEYRTTSSLSNVSVRENTNLTNTPSNGSPGYSY